MTWEMEEQGCFRGVSFFLFTKFIFDIAALLTGISISFFLRF